MKPKQLPMNFQIGGRPQGQTQMWVPQIAGTKQVHGNKILIKIDQHVGPKRSISMKTNNYHYDTNWEQ